MPIAMIEQRDIAVWIASGLLAAGIGWSRYAKWKTRDRLVREIAAMDPEKRAKFLGRLDPKLAMEIREQLLERFRIMT
jgi:flagellar motility protein MotE (MotC chaperone)